MLKEMNTYRGNMEKEESEFRSDKKRRYTRMLSLQRRQHSGEGSHNQL